jgi:hypothetical protein
MVKPPKPAAPTEPTLAVITVEALTTLIRESVVQAINEALENQGPALLDRTNTARALGIGSSSVDRFRKLGMPCVWVGDMPRFIIGECIDWMREHRRHLPDGEKDEE